MGAARYGTGVRVIGGRSRGRRLSGRLPAGVRPTSDRVREAIFDVLGSMGGVNDLAVVDLFCGSGAMGVEALSRGAASATFVDHEPGALEAVRANLAAVGLEGESATVLRAELPGWLERSAPFDIAFCDPPYAFDDWETLLGWLQADVAILESADEIAVPHGWEVTRSRRYGSTLVTVVRQAPSPSVIGS
jgi:16S rRNA (guanine966-N2)-methyltransferase